MNRLKTILSIAGSDSSGGAGIQADIKIASMHGVYASTVITAVTSQSTSGITDITILPPSSISSQLKAVFYDQKPDAIKIGMLGNVDTLLTVIGFLKDNAVDIPIVADTVLNSTTGCDLTGKSESYENIFTKELAPLATVVTPNIPEALRFLNLTKEKMTEKQISDEYIVEQLYLLFNSKAVVLKGGHSHGNYATDRLMTRNNDSQNLIKTFISKKIDSGNLHGTGCVYSTLMACALANGKDLEKAFLFASETIHAIIEKSVDYQFGNNGNGPLDICNYLRI